MVCATAMQSSLIMLLLTASGIQADLPNVQSKSGSAVDSCVSETTKASKIFDCGQLGDENLASDEDNSARGSLADLSRSEIHSCVIDGHGGRTSRSSDFEKAVIGESSCQNDSPRCAAGYHKEHLSNFCAIRAKKAETLARFSEGVEFIFHEIEALLAKFTRGHDDRSENSSHSIDTAKDETNTAFESAIDAYIRAILLYQEQSSSSGKIHRSHLHFAIRRIVNLTYRGMRLIRHKDDDRIVQKIRAYEDEVISDRAAELENAIFDAILNRANIHPAIKPTVRRNQGKAFSAIVTACRGVFTGIRILLDEVYPELGLGIGYNSSSLKLAHDQAASGFRDTVENGFGSLEAILTIEYSRNKDEILDKLTALNSNNRTGITGVKHAIDVIFTTITNHMANVSCRYRKVTDHHTQETENAKEETYTAFDEVLASSMNSVSIISPKSTLVAGTHQSAARSSLRKLTDDIWNAMNLCYSNDSSGIEAQRGVFENSVTREATTLISNIYIPILNGQKHSRKIENAIQSAKEKSTSEVVKTSDAIFEGLNILLGEFCHKIPYCRKGGRSKIDDLTQKAFTAMRAELESHNDLFVMILLANARKEAGLTAKFCSPGAD